MVNIEVGRSNEARTDLKKYGYEARRLRTTLTRTPWRNRTKSIKNPRTKAEMKAITERRRELRDNEKSMLKGGQDKVIDFARECHAATGTHTVKWWVQAIIHSLKKWANQRETTEWNAWLHMMKQKRDEEGLPGKKANELGKEASAAWELMTKEERTEVTAEAIKELQERKEMRTLSLQNVPIAAFNDLVGTQRRIEEEIKQLHARTNIETLVIMVRSDLTHYNQPWTLTSSDAVERFFALSLKRELGDFANQMESYCLSGIAGAVETCEKQINALKAEASSIILDALATTARPDIVGRMYYQDFESHITRKYGIIIEGWPLKKFASPGSNSSRPELEILVNAWKNGTAHFRRLSQSEFAAWEKSKKPGVFGLNAPWAYEQDGDTPDTSQPDSATPAPQEPNAPNSTNANASPDTSAAAGGPPSDPSSAIGANVPPPAPTYDTTIPDAPTSAPPSDAFVLSFADGSGSIKAPRKRKARSDKGKPRGPNARSKKSRTEAP